MKMIKIVTLITLFGIYSVGWAQNTDQVKKKGPEDTYARSSISYLLLDFGSEKYSEMLKNAINTTRMPEKFDNNDIRKKVIPAPYYHGEQFPDLKGNARSVLTAMNAESYAIEVVKYWWKIKDNGNYFTSLIKERGEYNATDEDFNQAMATKVGRAKIGDYGLKLIGNSYVLVLDYGEIKTMDEIYDEQDEAARKKAEKEKTEFKPVDRVKNGFQGKLTAYLFQMNYPDTVQGYFDNAFIDEKKIDLEKLDHIFDEVYSPFKLITTEVQKVEGTQPNPGKFLAPAVQKTPDELMVVMVNDGITKVLNSVEMRIEAFKVKTPVTNLSPIRAKIGKKESLSYERRYFVWQYVGDANNNVTAKKKGVIRAKKVVDNRNDELGNTQESSFYQIGGGKITEGMTLQEAKDFGIGLGLGGGQDGFVMSLDINVGQFLNAPIKQFKLYGDIGIGGFDMEPSINPTNYAGSTFPATGASSNFKSFKFAIGLLKEYPFMRNFLFGWNVGWGAENISWKDGSDLDEKLLGSGLLFGGRIGLNLKSPSLQLIGSVNYRNSGTITSQYTPKDQEQQSDITEYKWTDIFPDKSPVSINLSLRLNF